MMRQLFQFLSTQKEMRKWMETSPAARKLTRRFIAGETLEDELSVCARLASGKTFSALDHLGENVTSLAQAASSRDAYLAALDEIEKRGLPSTVSIKLSQFGLDLSPEACLENVQALSNRARAAGSRVEIDMESAQYTDHADHDQNCSDRRKAAPVKLNRFADRPDGGGSQRCGLISTHRTLANLALLAPSGALDLLLRILG